MGRCDAIAIMLMVVCIRAVQLDDLSIQSIGAQITSPGTSLDISSHPKESTERQQRHIRRRFGTLWAIKRKR